MGKETPLDFAARKAEEAYNRIRSPGSPFFAELDGGTRCVALAAAMLAAEPMRQALLEIIAMETPGANATVRRMVQTAKLAIGAGFVADLDVLALSQAPR